MSTTMVPYCPFSDNSVLWQNHFSPGSHFWPDELPCHFKMKNCNAILIASFPTRKKFHFPVGVIKSTHTEYWINGAQIIRTISRVEFIQFPIHFSYIFNHFSSTFDVDKKWIIQDFFFIAGGILRSSSKPYTSQADTCYALFLWSHNSTTVWASKIWPFVQ